jgi:peptidoglycan-associated lipoprotein
MRHVKNITLLLACVSISILTGCAWFRGETIEKSMDQSQNVEQEHMQTDDMLPGAGSNSGDIVMDLGSGDVTTLSARPTKDWKAMPGSKVILYFGFDQSGIGTSQIGQLEAVAKYLNAHSNIGLIIEGNCDERGSHEYNIGLGERRALAVRDYLVRLGVPDSKLQTISYGSERPIDSSHNEGAYLKNRRAELIPAKM